VVTVRRLTSGTLLAVALVVAVLVVGASIADAIRTDSLEPLSTIAWLPAILVGVFYRPTSGRRRCFPRLRRSQS
jgi:hypothetical protein